ncbi:MAG: DNA methyltransferase [Chloroflexi bacterium]|nr:DNA methyltransferase [Chloroflexota bacterium]
MWCYHAGGASRRYFPRKHDVVLLYGKNSRQALHHPIRGVPYRDIYAYDKSGNLQTQNGYHPDGKMMSDWWEIAQMSSVSKERMGYPTQKPVALYERMAMASSNEDDIILDPFCGCGTTLHAAQNLNRRWIGIDICVNACKVIEQRLKGHFDSLWNEVEFVGMPKTRDDAQFMAGSDPFRFERWAASLVDGMEANRKQRGDGGIDGWGRLPLRKGRFVDMVSQVKGGHTNPGHVQAFNGARQQAGADLGIFTCFEERVTAGMRNAAVSAGVFMDAPVVQIYTIEDYFEGRKPAMPVSA